MKARYFSKTDIMHVSVPSFSSVIWRAIVAGRDAMNLSLIHRIGDGSNMSIWSNKVDPGYHLHETTIQTTKYKSGFG